MIDLSGFPSIFTGGVVPSLVSVHIETPEKYKVGQFAKAFLLSLTAISFASISLNWKKLGLNLIIFDCSLPLIQVLALHFACLIVICITFSLVMKKMSSQPIITEQYIRYTNFKVLIILIGAAIVASSALVLPDNVN